MLVQEMAFKVDMGFLNALLELFASEEATEEQQLTAFKQDCVVIHSKLDEEAAKSSAGEPKHYFDELHLSPLKVKNLSTLL